MKVNLEDPDIPANVTTLEAVTDNLWFECYEDMYSESGYSTWMYNLSIDYKSKDTDFTINFNFEWNDMEPDMGFGIAGFHLYYCDEIIHCGAAAPVVSDP